MLDKVKNGSEKTFLLYVFYSFSMSTTSLPQKTTQVLYLLSTQVGDPQEVNGIVSVFCQSKREPLLIGSTKSNMGHPEPASGLAALAKVSVTAHLSLAENSLLLDHI